MRNPDRPPTGASTPGTLANNFMFVRGLQTALAKTETDLAGVRSSLKVVLREGCWREWATPEGLTTHWNAADFRLFVESPRPAGCQTPIHVMRELLKGTELATTFEDAIRGKPGNPTGVNQHTSGNRHDITVSTDADNAPPTIPLSPSVPRPKRDPAREAPTGTSVSYAIRRLKKEAPELAEQVVKGERTAYSAGVEAGFFDRRVSISLDPPRAAKIIVKNFGAEPLADLTRALADHLGFDLVPRKDSP